MRGVAVFVSSMLDMTLLKFTEIFVLSENQKAKCIYEN
jgi:hypothetical protein